MYTFIRDTAYDSMEITNHFIEEELKRIFDASKGTPFNELLDRGYVFPCANLHKKDGLLFVGINPSYDNRNDYRHYGYKDTGEKKIPHFEHFRKAAHETGFADNWSCIDLFYFRETKQNEINELFKKEKGIDFLCEQLKLTQKIIETIRPQMIVVSNRMARWFWGVEAKEESNVWMGYKFKELSSNCYSIEGIRDDSILKTTQTNLTSTKIIFSRSFLYMKKEVRSELISTIKGVAKTSSMAI